MSYKLGDKVLIRKSIPSIEKGGVIKYYIVTLTSGEISLGVFNYYTYDKYHKEGFLPIVDSTDVIGKDSKLLRILYL